MIPGSAFLWTILELEKHTLRKSLYGLYRAAVEGHQQSLRNVGHPEDPQKVNFMLDLLFDQIDDLMACSSEAKNKVDCSFLKTPVINISVFHPFIQFLCMYFPTQGHKELAPISHRHWTGSRYTPDL